MYSVHISTVHCTVYNIYSAHDILAVVELIDEVNIRTSGVVGAGLEPAPRGVHCLDSGRQSGQHTLQQFGGTLGLALNRDKVTSLTYTKEGEIERENEREQKINDAFNSGQYILHSMPKGNAHTLYLDG